MSLVEKILSSKRHSSIKFLYACTPETLTVQITGNVASTRDCTSRGARGTRISISCDTQSALARAWLSRDDSHALASRLHSRENLYLQHGWIIIYGWIRFVCSKTLFLCCSSVTDHLLSAMPRLSIETRCRVMFLFSGGMRLSSIQERLMEEGYKISLR